MDALKMLEKYVSMPSGSGDYADVNALADIIIDDIRALGFDAKPHEVPGKAKIIEATYGYGSKKIMLMGHMDTVFPRSDFMPFRIEGDTAYGSGVMDMKGGIVIMLCALKKVLAGIDKSKYTLQILINPDEEIGSPTSHALIYESAQTACACLSFEPSRPSGALVCERKGVTSFTLICRGVRGHAGMAYKSCHSAIQELCHRIERLYTLRDDARDISINVGSISGGTAENVVADYAEAHCEYRYFDMVYKDEIGNAISAICAEPGIEGCTTELSFGASHPAAKLSEGSQRLFNMARDAARSLGGDAFLEQTGGAGDISIAAVAGAPVLDGLGMEGAGAHTRQESADLTRLPYKIELAARLIAKVTGQE